MQKLLVRKHPQAEVQTNFPLARPLAVVVLHRPDQAEVLHRPQGQRVEDSHMKALPMEDRRKLEVPDRLGLLVVEQHRVG